MNHCYTSLRVLGRYVGVAGMSIFRELQVRWNCPGPRELPRDVRGLAALAVALLVATRVCWMTDAHVFPCTSWPLFVS